MSPVEAWTCPTCQRLVPLNLGVCRCGYLRKGIEAPAVMGVAAPPPPAPAPSPDPESASTHAQSGTRPGILVLGALVAGIGLTYLALRTPAASERVTTQTEIAATDAASAETTPGQVPASAAQRWPADSALWKDAPASGPAEGNAPKPMPSQPGTDRTESVEDVVSGAMPAVVLIETADAKGTGFFVANDTVITNAHVVDGVTYVTIRSASGEQTSAVVTMRSTELDLAALRVAKTMSGQTVLPLGSSADIRVGQEIVAIGSPMGLQNTVTRGIVSSLRRANGLTLVQTDAAINPGNSGGPLLDRHGRVIAVATMKLAGQAESLGFGVAAEHVRALLDGGGGTVTASGHRPSDVLTGGSSAGASGGMDSERDAAAEAYERLMAEASQRADQLDRSWQEIAAKCISGPVPSTSGDRDWFVLWERFDDERVAPACGSYYASFKAAASEFRGKMTQAADIARRGGMYPGECRDVRHRNHVDWSDW